MTLDITVSLNSCNDCRHVDHSGSFTVRGARQICGHSNACGVERISKKKFKKEYLEYHTEVHGENWLWHWIHRVLAKSSKENIKGIPEWCPLKHGSCY